MSWGDFLGGAAATGLGIIQNEQDRNAKYAEEQRMAQIQSDLRMKEEATAAALRSQYAQSNASFENNLKQQPMNDFATAVGSHLGDTAPNEAPAPVKTVNGIIDRASMTGVDGQPLNGDTPGLTGDISKLRAQIVNSQMSDEDKQGALAQLDAQAGQANQVNAAMSPPTRAVTQDEATTLGMQDLLKSGKGAAYAAGLTANNIDAKTQNMQNRLDFLTQQAADKNANFQDRTNMLAEIAKIRAQAVIDGAQLKVDAANERAANGIVKNSTLNAQLNSETQNIRATTSLISTLTHQLADLTGKNDVDRRQAVQDEIDGYKQDIENSKGVKNLILKQLGMPTVDDLNPSKPASTAPPSGYKPGDTQTVQSGPNKGKTAVFDGTGWKLQ